MNEQFQHVMVLTSIIIGLGITHLLGGLGAAIDRISTPEKGFRPSLIHGAWAGFVFVWLVSFWWWQFRLLGLVTNWTMGRYLFIVFYAVLLFLLVVILVPRDWDRTSDLDAYFFSKRHWFFAVFLLGNGVDFADSYLKGGWDYVVSTGPLALLLLIATVPVFVVGVMSTNRNVHRPVAVLMLIMQIVVCFNTFPNLGT